MDGSQIGELEYENFNAAGAKITFKGKSVHPGYAKGKMINSMLLASKFISKLPKERNSRKNKRLWRLLLRGWNLRKYWRNSGWINYQRSFIKKIHQKKKNSSTKLANKFNKKWKNQFGDEIVIAEVKDQYYNMKERLNLFFISLKLQKKRWKNWALNQS